jgi:WD40 repeat protein
MIRFRDRFAASAFCLLITWSAAAGVELPDESVVPGQASTIDELSPELPDESQLPRQEVVSIDSAASVPQAPSAPDLPGEDQVTPAPAVNDTKPADPNVTDPNRNAQELAAMRLDQSPDEMPWLRIEAKGPTAPIRALAFTPDSQRIISGGQDKALTIWRNTPDAFRANQKEWGFERTIHWPIQRGHRGQIQTIAVSDQWIAAAGQAAYGGNGDIFLFDAAGNLKGVLFDDVNGHRQAVVSLSFSPDRQRPALVSADMSGKIVYWNIPDPQRGIWKGTPLRSTDRILLGEETADRLIRSREFAPVVMLDSRRIVFPEFWQFNQQKLPVWKLHIMDVQSRQGRELVSPNPLRQNYPWHGVMVTSLAASRDGRRLASADAAGQRYLWNVGAAVTFQRLPGTTPAISLAFDGLGRRLAVGSALSATTGHKPRLEIFDVTRPSGPIAAVTTNHDVYACAFSPDDSTLAYAQGDHLLLRRPSSNLELVADLKPSSRAPGRVAISAQLPYRIAFGYIGADGRSTDFQNVFDTRRVQLDTAERIQPENWRTGEQDRGRWSLRKVTDANSPETYWLYEDQNRRGQIPLHPVRHGVPSAVAWMKDPRAAGPAFVIVGLSGTNNIYVFRIAREGICETMRQFRGHSAKVNSLAVSHDDRYLVSSSMDGSIRVWPLHNVGRVTKIVDRWGATFSVQNGQVIVDSIRTDGPLYFRGIRQADRITRLRYYDATMDDFVAEPSADQIVARLEKSPWDELLEFQYERGDARPKAFQMFPAWQQVVSLATDDAREWAYWSPAGYYDASFEGHKLFGWQVNRGRNEAPDYFLAAQFRAALERPEVMSRLLEAGSIDDAFRLASLDAPARPDQAIMDQYRLKPQIRIVGPRRPLTDSDTSITFQAEISAPQGERLVPPKAFANGVVATDRRLVAARTEPDDRSTEVYEWTAQLPSSHRVLVQVVAGTESEAVDVQEFTLERKTLPPRRTPQLYIATVGINQYDDTQIQRLDFAVNNASQVADAMKTFSKRLYHGEVLSLLDDYATRPMWQIAIESIAQLRPEVSPDDLLVIFMSGHGLRDEETGNYYYVGVDARYEDLVAHRFGRCLSLADLAPLADIPCRKLVVLDTCHAGAINPDLTRQLKSALRMLQDDMFFTLTASDGNEEAVELREKRLGRFTYRLLEALRGEADRQTGNKDGIVTFSEVIAYVKQKVQADSAAELYAQHPTAGPRELLEVADFPLTHSRQ